MLSSIDDQSLALEKDSLIDGKGMWSQQSAVSCNDDRILELFNCLRGRPGKGGPGKGGPKEIGPQERHRLREHLVMLHRPLVEHCAYRLAASHELLEDLTQEGYIGLIKAVDRFDPHRGVRFSTYAYHLIAGEMKHYLRDCSKLIHEPGWHAELRHHIGQVTEQLTQQLSRAPSAEEIAKSLNLKADTVRNAMQKQAELTVESLDDRIDDQLNEVKGPKDTWSFLDDPPEELFISMESQIDNQLLLNAALPRLRQLESQVVQLFYMDELSKSDIARRLGISVNYVAYLIKRGIGKLQLILGEDGEGTLEVTPGSQRQSQRTQPQPRPEL